MQNNKNTSYSFIAYRKKTYPADEMIKRCHQYYEELTGRRSVRDFSDQQVPEIVIEHLIASASTAPSGAHKQPWTFCVVKDAEVKRKIRMAAEAEEKVSYESRMPAQWLNDLAPLGTDWEKPFLEKAPYLIVVFKRSYEWDSLGEKHPNYYVTESCGIACGFLLAAIHNAGLAALTHTPSPMNFLSEILGRPENEKPFLLIPVGYAADDCTVPDLKRKQLSEVCTWI